jgi:hypothetical protein
MLVTTKSVKCLLGGQIISTTIYLIFFNIVWIVSLFTSNEDLGKLTVGVVIIDIVFGLWLYVNCYAYHKLNLLRKQATAALLSKV